MKQEHIHFDGLLKPEILDKLKVLKGGTFGGPYAEGATISFDPNSKCRFEENLHEITLHGKSVFGVGYQQGDETIVKYLSFYSHWEEEQRNSNAFYIGLLDELPQSLLNVRNIVFFSWFNDVTQTRRIKNIQFYGTNQDFSRQQEIIEFIVFNFTNQPKIFLVNDWRGCLKIHFDLDISITEFIQKQGYEENHNKDKEQKVVLLYEV